MPLDLNDPRPPYQQIVSALRDAIERGDAGYRTGDRLPSGPELAKRFSVARGTVDRALGDLRDEGLIVTRQGSGSFVRTGVVVADAGPDHSSPDAPGGTMPRGTINVTDSARTGALLPAPTVGDPTNGHSVANDGRVMLLVENSGSTVPRTVTLQMSKSVDGLTLTGSRTVSVAAGATRLLGPYPTADYGAALLVDVDNAELKIRAIRAA
ncbi:GntR family transcriptional regulator [Kitasatospora purpeofusca]|uniref:GntR family transcriptional regulator n=1 Tax=Kitasatospora purpeofusca TaxID=67352 RepID=UPI0035DF4A20